ncbi:Oidioi.mRNA.OKI2018_I69.PAR.g10207.t1.cds [Oikopleura dioica]|uniref:Oidioi.mRNA.OKI2018_I69.PAR.g10207.t1.cds n=1 Tax=Oikopleura dioica TaxID=34765 RepID=A0ABN7RT19_OIKDI|nr:Oidioi.mRNA.OKI2018_I69.PAR.g10207.t1.cds [Oikopleura dioica]
MNPDGAEAIKVDAIVKYVYETLVPFVSQLVIPTFMGQPENVEEETIENAKIAGYSYFTELLGENEYLTGANMTWVDFLVYGLLIQMELHPKFKYEENEKLNKWYTRIQALPFFHIVHKGREVF